MGAGCFVSGVFICFSNKIYMDVKINVPFRVATNGFDKSETYRIKAVDVDANKVTVEVQKEFHGEIWATFREWTWLKTLNGFCNNGYEYL